MTDILVVEDEVVLARSICAFLERRGFSADFAPDARNACGMLQRESPRLVILDVRLGKDNGLDLLENIRATAPETHVVVMTGHGEIGLAVDAMKRGARDFLTKPTPLAAIATIASDLMLGEQGRPADPRGLDRILGRSSAAVELRNQIRKLAAAADAGAKPGVLITGPSGAGKAEAARALFEAARRPASPVEIDCSLDAGALERAEGADALLLRRIDALPPEGQDRLARRLGQEDAPWVVATTGANLAALERQGRFRADLLYRLQSGWVEVPSLAERSADILALAETLARRAALRYGRARPRLTAEVRVRLLEHDWPGNVRELATCMERAILSAREGLVAASDITILTAEGDGARGVLNLIQMEETALAQALQTTRGNVSRAAGLLGISRDTLRYRMEKYGLSRH